MREDEIVKNKYNFPIKRQCFEDYIKLLMNLVFKTLPVYEGRDAKTKQIIYTPEQAYSHFQMHLEELIIEVTGDYYIYNDDPKFLQLLSILDGLRDVQINQHQIVRSIVFKCMNICEELKNK